MNGKSVDSRLRPGFVALVICLLAAVLVPIWMWKSKSPPPAAVELVGAPDPIPAAGELVGAPDPIAFSGEGGAATVTPGQENPVTTQNVATRPAEQAPGVAPTQRVAGTETATQPAGPGPIIEDTEYQRRVAQATERVYSALVKPEKLPSNGGPNAVAPAGTPSGASGIRGYVENDRARRALIEELRVIRRAAIAEANRPATNR